MECQDLYDNLHRLVDEDLSPEDYEACLEFLKECDEVRKCDKCQKAMEGIRHLKEILASSAATPSPATLLEAVRQRLACEESEES